MRHRPRHGATRAFTRPTRALTLTPTTRAHRADEAPPGSPEHIWVPVGEPPPPGYDKDDPPTYTTDPNSTDY
jgi:hypothetical protein